MGNTIFSRARIIELRIAGKLVREIAADLRCSDKTVYLVLREAKLTGPNIPDAAYERLRALGYSLTESKGDRRRFRKVAEIESRIIGLRRAGNTQKEIAAEIGCSATTVRKILRARGMSRVGIPPERLYELQSAHRVFDHGRIVELRKAGKTLREITAEIGCSEKTVIVVLRRAKLTGPNMPDAIYARLKTKIQTMSRNNEGTRPDIVRLRKDGLTYDAIAETLGCSRSFVGKVLRQSELTGERMPDRARANLYESRNLALHQRHVRLSRRTVAELTRAGKSARQIADALGCSRNTIVRIRAENRERAEIFRPGE